MPDPRSVQDTRFHGSSENAAAVYVLLAIINKGRKLKASLQALVHILSVTVFEKVSLPEALAQTEFDPMIPSSPIELTLLDS